MRIQGQKRLTIIVAAITTMITPLLFILPTAASGCNQTVTNINNSGSGSLRQALSSVTSGGTICFAIGSGHQIIQPTSQLNVGVPAIIDGSTQPGYSGTPLIEINGQNAPGAVGLNVTAGNTTVKGLDVTGFSGDGIILNNNGGDTIIGNYSGVDVSGTVAKPNGASGIGVGSAHNIVGGTTPATRNLVSGNGGTGIAISNSGSSNNVVEGNYVGTDPTGTNAVPNGADGILITNAPNNTIGGTTGVTVGGDCTGACNLTSGNHSNGIGILSSAASGNTVAGNYAGVTVHGNSALPNGDIGFEAQDAPNNTIGGLTPAARNIFSGNLGAGVSLTSTYSTGNVVEGNYIGVDVSGNAPLGNHKMGVNIGSPGGGSNNASSNTIGGTTGTTPGGSCTGACNVISANTWSGIYISGNTGGANNITGNFIGPGASGGSNLGNLEDGVGIVDSANNHFGGPILAARNLIAGNGGNGFAIIGSDATGTRIEGNYIGEGTDGGCMPNKVDGVVDASALYTAIIGNAIFCSGYLGVDLGNNGVTANHQGGAIGGPNEYQNQPLLRGAYPSGNTTAVIGSLNSDPGTSFRIDFFSSPYCDRSGHGQAQTFLGSGNVTTDNGGNVSFLLNASSTNQAASITATATKIINGTPWETSELSGCVTTPRQHPDGSIIRPLNSPNIFRIINGQVSQIGSVAVLNSYNITSSQIKDATTADTNLTGTSNLYFRNGTVVRASGQNIYVIETISGTPQKQLITSSAAFNGLGYAASDIIQVNDADLPSANGANIGSASVHPDGTLVQQNGAVSLVASGQLGAVPTPAVLQSLQYRANQIKPATNGDLALNHGSGVSLQNGTVVKGSGPAIYVIYNNGSILEKRQLGSASALSELELLGPDIIGATDAELGNVATGITIP